MPVWLEKIVVSFLLKQLTAENLATAETWVKSFVVCELKQLAAKTPTEIDDQVIARVAELLGVKCPVA